MPEGERYESEAMPELALLCLEQVQRFEWQNLSKIE